MPTDQLFQTHAIPTAKSLANLYQSKVKERKCIVFVPIASSGNVEAERMEVEDLLDNFIQDAGNQDMAT